MRIGIDLVKISRAKSLIANPSALNKILTPEELTDNSESVAGIIAVKEAYFKATDTKGDWLSLKILHKSSGKPILVMTDGRIINSISITHDGEYAAAVVLLE